MDFSTINLDLLAKLPAYTPAANYVSNQTGSGCAGDAPGYPSYFIQHVYTPNGNTPRRGASAVIRDPQGVYRTVSTDEDYDKLKALLRRLWKPLPFDHERTQAWVRETYRHHAKCYRDDDRLITTARDSGIFIYPVPSYQLRSFQDDHRFSDEWRVAEQAAVAAHNRSVVERARALATPANHSGHRIVLGFYPEATPRLDLIETPPTTIDGLWWETEATRPTPAACRPRSCGPHPVNVTRCQWCGWDLFGDPVVIPNRGIAVRAREEGGGSDVIVEHTPLDADGTIPADAEWSTMDDGPGTDVSVFHARDAAAAFITGLLRTSGGAA
jgi:hypothetical protein